MTSFVEEQINTFSGSFSRPVASAPYVVNQLLDIQKSTISNPLILGIERSDSRTTKNRLTLKKIYNSEFLVTRNLGESMKKLIALGMAVFAILAVSAIAGDYHTGVELRCNDCHIMHASQAHAYGTEFYTVPATPHEYLLRNEVNPLCLSCHDNHAAVAPDVLGTNSGSNVRLAGALNDAATVADGYGPNTGHTLDAPLNTAPGGHDTTTAGLECVNCHNPHGSWAGPNGDQNPYRNLSFASRTAVPITYAVGTNDLTKDVFETDSTFGGNHYDVSNVNFNEPNSNGSQYGLFCAKCHADFHGAQGAANMGGTVAQGTTGGFADWLRHPTAGTNIGQATGGHSKKYTASGGIYQGIAANAYRVKVMSPTGVWGTQGTVWGAAAPNDLTPSCFSCHKSHGNQNAFGLIFATGSQPITENGDGQYRDLCRQCHSQGGRPGQMGNPSNF